ncbi:MFS general substrate transporter [Daedaleopsis nitida]|nr:MFS general substrate transporter [Daedaleopsis nitida]
MHERPSTDTKHPSKATFIEKGEIGGLEEDASEPTNAPDVGEETYQYLLSYQYNHAGRLVLDPRRLGFQCRSAPSELGDEIAQRLKLSPDGSKVLWPQPRDDPDDPQNWSSRRKSLQLAIVTIAAMVPDFDSSIGIAAVFAMASDFGSTPNRVTQLGSGSWGGIFAVMFIRRYGRLPVLFWSQVLALAFVTGTTFAPNLNTSASMRCLGGFFGTCSQVSGLYVVTDMYPFHLQARKLSIWTMGFVISPVLAPFCFGFFVARANWRWSYGVGSLFGVGVVLLVALCMEETAYDRRLPNPNPLQYKRSSLRYRLETLVGVTGVKMARYRNTWKDILVENVRVVWRPHLLLALVFEVTNTVILARPPPAGYGYDQIQIAGTYASSIVSVVVGEVAARYLMDWLLEVNMRQNKGVFVTECRLWACYPAVVLFVGGFLLQGAAFEKHLHIAVLVAGWVFAQVATMINTAAIYAYCSDCFPRHQGEISALLNLARSLGGFSFALFQVDWVSHDGAFVVFGAEAAIVGGLFLLIVPFLQLKGVYLRARFST